MNMRKAIVTGMALFAVTLGCAGCHGGQASSTPPAPQQAQDELNQIQTTLDAIDSEMAGDGSP
ncbi:hypothetical protein [Amycolatopsis sp. GM8]|uniref:hypothetical protein n=1 Tax=Amycolatopsis sp. GM8 TaxID=2896530 RepID=UPI001F31E794|nr:hypothetical protein [Amycolatopsis sp. GM8]